MAIRIASDLRRPSGRLAAHRDRRAAWPQRHRAARHLGVTRQAMSNLLNARAGLSADMAIRFEKAFSVKADTLLRMQTAFELAQARANESAIRVAPFRKAA